jgi:hypothetical protein
MIKDMRKGFSGISREIVSFSAKKNRAPSKTHKEISYNERTTTNDDNLS